MSRINSNNPIDNQDVSNKKEINSDIKAKSRLKGKEVSKNEHNRLNMDPTEKIKKELHSNITSLHGKVEADQTSQQKHSEGVSKLFHLHVKKELIQGDEQPQTEEEALHAKKTEIIKNNFAFDRAPLILRQARRYPLMLQAVQEIRHNFEELEHCISEAQHGPESNRQANLERAADLEKKLIKQISNLGSLSEAIDNGIDDETEDRIMMGISMLEVSENTNPSQKALSKTFNSFVKGENDQLTTEDLEGIIREVISISREEDSQKITESSAREERRRSPISKRAIEMQAQLHHAQRVGKAGAKEQQNLKPLGTSTNDVYRLLDPHDDSKEVAYHKVGKRGEEAAGVMESLIWNSALIMGNEEQFVPTGIAEVRSKEQHLGGTEQVVAWTKEGELETIDSAQKVKKGSIQPAQKGQALGVYFDNQKVHEISKDEVRKGVVTSLVLGMYDAHAGNIIVTDEGKLKFFDNTRSLPNSNGFIDKGGMLVSSYRCTLLDLPQSKEKLTDSEKVQLKKEIAEYRVKVQHLQGYLKSKKGQAQLKKLPPGWIDEKKALDALEERLQRMENALNEDKVDSLVDLACYAIPNYRFSYGFMAIYSLADHVINDQVPPTDASITGEEIHTYVGAIAMNDEDWAILAYSGIDFKKIKEWADDESLSFEDFESNVVNHFRNTFGSTISSDQRKSVLGNSAQLYASLYEQANVDAKDWDYGRSVNTVADRNSFLTEQYYKALNLDGMTFLYHEINDKPIEDYIMACSNDSTDIAIMVDKNTDEAVVVFRTPTGYRRKNIKLIPFEGMIEIDGQKLSGPEFLKMLKLEGKKAPTYNELPVLSMQNSQTICKRSPKKVCIRKSSDKKSLVITRFHQGKFEHIKFKAGQDGKFLWNGRNLTISQAMNYAMDRK